ncbi:hypothetical protein HMPREF0239_00284 [Clostridium sp. ATCC BAA-442]|nr:hypothetical protein HMPREF0239_00284 [Clostridium sp. ATCC BAA-442]
MLANLFHKILRRKEPKGAEENLNAALGRLVSGQIQDTTEQVQ